MSPQRPSATPVSRSHRGLRRSILHCSTIIKQRPGTTKPDPQIVRSGVRLPLQDSNLDYRTQSASPRAHASGQFDRNGVLLDHLAGLGQNAELTVSLVQIKPDAIHGSAFLPARSQRRLPDPERYCHYQGRPATSSQLKSAMKAPHPNRKSRQRDCSSTACHTTRAAGDARICPLERWRCPHRPPPGQTPEHHVAPTIRSVARTELS